MENLDLIKPEKLLKISEEKGKNLNQLKQIKLEIFFCGISNKK